MFIRRFFGCILILIGLQFFVVSGGCALLGVATIYEGLVKGGLHRVGDLGVPAVLTFIGLAASITMMMQGYALCRRKKDVDQGERQTENSIDMEDDIISDENDRI